MQGWDKHKKHFWQLHQKTKIQTCLWQLRCQDRQEKSLNCLILQGLNQLLIKETLKLLVIIAVGRFQSKQKMIMTLTQLWVQGSKLLLSLFKAGVWVFQEMFEILRMVQLCQSKQSKKNYFKWAKDKDCSNVYLIINTKTPFPASRK